MMEHGLHLRRKVGDEPLGTLLYVHGLGESGSCFARLSEHPGLRHWTHWIPDLVGYGDSPPTDVPLTLEDHAARLAEMLAVEHPEPVVVVGHSMGGVIGTALTESAPERVRAFVDVEGNVSGEDCHYSGRVAAVQDETEWLARGFREFVAELSRDPDPVIASYRTNVERCDPRTLYRNACELVRVSKQERLAERLALLVRPVVFIHGTERGLSERSLGLLRETGIEPRPVTGAGHWPFLDRPDELVATLGAFLDGLGPPGSASRTT